MTLSFTNPGMKVWVPGTDLKGTVLVSAGYDALIAFSGSKPSHCKTLWIDIREATKLMVDTTPPAN